MKRKIFGCIRPHLYSISLMLLPVVPLRRTRPRHLEHLANPVSLEQGSLTNEFHKNSQCRLHFFFKSPLSK